MSEGVRTAIVSASVIGTAEIRDRFQRVGSDVRARVKAALAGLASEAQARARAVAPSLSGRLRASISATVRDGKSGIAARVFPRKVRGADAYYAHFVEFGVVNHGGARNKAQGGFRKRRRAVTAGRAAGAWRQKPRPFMAPAWEAIRSRVRERLAAAVADAVEG